MTMESPCVLPDCLFSCLLISALMRTLDALVMDACLLTHHAMYLPMLVFVLADPRSF